MSYAELEISLRQLLPGRYEVELRFSDPEPLSARVPVRAEAFFDFAELRCLELHPEDYGKALARQLFHSKEVCKYYQEIRSVTSSRDQHLRIRLWIHPSAVKLNPLRWELLRDPDSEALLATSEKTPFSRSVEPRYDWLPVKLDRPLGSTPARRFQRAGSNQSRSHGWRWRTNVDFRVSGL